MSQAATADVDTGRAFGGSATGGRLLVEFSVLWRAAVIALIPVAVWGYVNLFEYVPQSAGDVIYEARINRITGSVCLDFGDAHAHVSESLRDLSCH